MSASILLPNLLILACPPRRALPAPHLSALLTWTERLGQAMCLVVPSMSATASISPAWMAPLIASVLAYWSLWGRYARLRTPHALFGRVWRVPVPMALLPVVAFASCALMLGCLWIGVSAALLAIGHVPASLVRARMLAHE